MSDSEPDAESALLIAQLALNDVLELRASFKGKGRADEPIPDEEYALQLQEAHLEEVLNSLASLSFARSLDAAIETDQQYVSMLDIAEKCAMDDHRAAEALRSGGRLPAQSAVQRAAGNPEFRLDDVEREDVASQAWEARAVIVTANDSDGGEGVDDDGEETVVGVGEAPEQLEESLPVSSRVECSICGSNMRTPDLQAPCGHAWCRGCLADLVRTCTQDETLYPLRCCQQSLPQDEVLALVHSLRIRTQFAVKAREFGTPRSQRVYCPNPHCSTFLGATPEPSTGLASSVVLGRATRRCINCGVSACLQCKAVAHPDKACEENKALAELKSLAQKQRWQTCPGCHEIVELGYGCYHMTCRCRTEFCYLCAARWKTCQCLLWDEQRLLGAAQRRVENAFGAGFARAAPQRYAAEVRRRTVQLRYDHECDRHKWNHRDGGGRCEMCRNKLPDFLWANLDDC
ncbi:hypothetical protein HGRIS_007149 [Hohenbuehelia grisea]|uniref:RBR-type E3 ubiquitin transferase n=1 Tax=Hohenbuehelia grisea TaxID=104357 RepID=A0ABR3JB63_9AGAR